MILGISGAILALAELLLSLFGAEESKKANAVDYSPWAMPIRPGIAQDAVHCPVDHSFLPAHLLFRTSRCRAPLCFSYLKFQGKEGWGITIAMTVSCWLFFYGPLCGCCIRHLKRILADCTESINGWKLIA